MQALIGALTGFIPAATALIWLYVHSKNHDNTTGGKQ